MNPVHRKRNALSSWHEQGEAVDANCDNEPDFACVIVNPPPPMDGDMDGFFAEDDCDDSNA